MAKGFLLAFLISLGIVFWLLPVHTTPTPVSGSTVIARLLPNADLTPGATNPAITQATTDKTICNPHWSTKSIRPPVSYTNRLKVQQIKQYAYADTKLADYEEDHLISLELGGSPTSPQNLWPEAYPAARDKDKVENYLHAQVCAHQLTLAEAQHEIATNWLAVYNFMNQDTNDN